MNSQFTWNVHHGVNPCDNCDVYGYPCMNARIEDCEECFKTCHTCSNHLRKRPDGLKNPLIDIIREESEDPSTWVEMTSDEDEKDIEELENEAFRDIIPFIDD